MSTAPRRVPVARAYRFELVKLLSQWRVRLLVAVCWLAPALFVAVVSRQASLPVDTLFGRQMHATGWAGPLVVLGFSGSWALPLVVSLVAGDVFASEDRLGTWRHLLMAVRSPRVIFASKALASLTVIVVLVAGLAVSGVVSGIAVIGDHALIGLDGHQLHEAAGTTALAWLCVLAPTLALAAVGLLGSVVLGRSPMGLLLPAVVALAMQLVLMLPLPLAARLALPGYAFVSWNGLFTNPAQAGPLLIGIVVSLVWAVVATALAAWIFVRRDFTTAAPERSLAAVGVPLVLFGITTAVLTPLVTGDGIDQAKVQQATATAFASLYRLQTGELNRPDVTETQLDTTAACTNGGSNTGPGNDWRCVVSWHLPGVDATGQAIYQLDINPLGRFAADGDGPKEVNGYFLVRTPAGDEPNPLWQFDGIVDLLDSKG